MAYSNWQPTLSWEGAKARSLIIHKIRAFLDERGLVEVETPVLCGHGATDVYLDSFQTNYNHSIKTDDLGGCELHLQTSPEYAMKRLLASGYQNIYQITKAFRNEPSGRYHNPEFTMLEWYRVDYDHLSLMNEVGDLLKVVLGCTNINKVTYQNVFIQFVGIDPLDVSLIDLFNVINKHNKWSDWMKTENDIDILLQVIFTEIIEPKIGVDTPCFIYEFPASQASLAKLSNHDPRVADRFECYYKGIELVNGFNELTCADDQLARFEQDNMKRAVLNKSEVVIDKSFIDALKSGLPQCAGVALGIDRLIMLALNKEHIQDVITFPTGRA